MPPKKFRLRPLTLTAAAGAGWATPHQAVYRVVVLTLVEHGPAFPSREVIEAVTKRVER
jgi:hypothetical protein